MNARVLFFVPPVLRSYRQLDASPLLFYLTYLRTNLPHPHPQHTTYVLLSFLVPADLHTSRLFTNNTGLFSFKSTASFRYIQFFYVIKMELKYFDTFKLSWPFASIFIFKDSHFVIFFSKYIKF